MLESEIGFPAASSPLFLSHRNPRLIEIPWFSRQVSLTNSACVLMSEPWLASVIGSHWMIVELLFRNTG